MSQISSQTPDPSWVSVSFAKFSHNSSPYGTRNFTWNHVGSRNDLDFILRSARVVDESGNFHTRILMKINAGAEELELQYLSELLQHVNAFDPASGGEIPVQVVIKSPFLAMRYPKSANIVRRIQLKFHNDSDFTKVSNFMKDLGLPITETMPAPPSISRPSVSPSPSLLSATSTSTSLTVPSMLSASSLSASSTRISLPTPGSSLHPTIHATDKSFNFTSNPSSASEFKVPIRPNSSFSETQRRNSALPYAVPQILRPATTSGVFNTSTTSPSLTGFDLSHKSMNQPTSLYILQMERESQSQKPSFPVLSVLENCQEGPRPILPLFQSQMNSQNHSSPEATPHLERQLSGSPIFAPRTISPEMRETITRELNPSSQDHGRQISDLIDVHGLAAAFFESAESTQLSVPPKRELPFPKPREVSKKRSASISSLPPLPKPTPASHPGSANFAMKEKESSAVAKTRKKRIAQRKSTIVKALEIAESPSPEKRSSVDGTPSQAAPEDEPSPLATKSAAVASGPTSAAPGLQSKASAPKKRAAPARSSSAAKRPKMVDQSTQTQTLSGRNHTTALQSFRNEEIPAPVIAPPPPTPTPTPAAPTESYLDAVDTFVTRHKARPSPQELWERPGWAEADVEQRQHLLNNFICENLENQEFLQLCEDMAVAWRRIGLGV